jgi:alkyl hydroperoxide reductase subunit AhpF
MPMLDESLQKEVAALLDQMVDPVEILFYPKAGDAASDAMDELLHDLAGLNSKVAVKRQDGPAPLVAPDADDEITSSVSVFTSNGKPTGVRYLGFPGGREFGTFLQDMVGISTRVAPELSPETVRFIENLEEPLHLQVFVTPT